MGWLIEGLVAVCTASLIVGSNGAVEDRQSKWDGDVWTMEVVGTYIFDRCRIFRNTRCEQKIPRNAASSTGLL